MKFLRGVALPGMRERRRRTLVRVLPIILVATVVSKAEDWPMRGGAPDRNMVARVKNLPIKVDPGKMEEGTETIDFSKGKNVRWVAKLGSQAFAAPVVAHGRVYVPTNNENPRDKKIIGDRRVLMCFEEKTGKFLWQLIVPTRPARRVSDWEYIGIVSTPAVEKDRLWVVAPTGELLCLDPEGMHNGNDGVFTDEADYMTVKPRGRTPEHAPLLTKEHADVLWSLDLKDPKGVGSMAHNVFSSHPVVHGDIVYVGTSNGVDWSHLHVPSPKAPGLIAVHKKTGKLIGEEISRDGTKLLHADWGGPSLGTIDGKTQVIWGSGTGMVFGFETEPHLDKKLGYPILRELWRYDANAPEYRKKPDGTPRKYASFEGPSEVMAPPAFHEGRAYITIGQDPEHGDGVGMLSCLDVSKRGDLTGKAIWTYQEIGRSLATPSIADGLVYAVGYKGILHCVDAKTGKKLWEHDVKSRVWGSQLVADGKVFVGTEDGELVILKAGREKKHLATIQLHSPIYDGVIAANDTLYVKASTHLYAFGK